MDCAEKLMSSNVAQSKMTTYDIYHDGTLMKESVKNYEAAKKHLTKMLKENGS